MIEEISSIFWAVLAVFGIILILILVPLFLLICCCCRKHQETLKKDIGSLVRNHNLIDETYNNNRNIENNTVTNRKLLQSTIEENIDDE